MAIPYRWHGVRDRQNRNGLREHATKIVGGGTLSADPGPAWHAIGTGDFNGDGHSDILFQSTSGQTAICDMNGTSIVGGGTVSANPGPSWRAVGLT